MPPASLFHAGNVCGAVETCFTFAWRRCCVSCVHVGHDDGDVLEPMVETAGILRNGPALVREMLRQRDAFVTQLKFRDPQLRATQSEQLIRCSRSRLRLRHFSNGKTFV